MRLLYACFKLFPTQNKVIFLSRQLNQPPTDFLMLEAEIHRRNPDVKVVMVCKRADGGLIHGIRFAWATIRSMYHLATARVCILDTYSLPVSLLQHKSSLRVIQIWHAMGKIKQSGYKNLDTEGGGRSSRVAKAMEMHKGYDLIVAGGPAWNKFYQESFNVGEEVLYNVGLPRIDYMLQQWDSLKAQMLEKYPDLAHKQVVVYAPTWRKTDMSGWDNFINQFDFEKFHLVLKSHPNQKLDVSGTEIYTIPEFSTLECLAIADYLVTDYSATAVEAAALDVKTYYYLYDYEIYSAKNGLNIDLFVEMPGCVFREAEDLVATLDAGSYNEEAFTQYKSKFLPDTIGRSTTLITDKIMENLEAS